MQTDDDIKRFNLSRDMLARLKKNFIFFITTFADDKFAKGARDFYSYFKLRIHFENDVPEVHEKPIVPLDKSEGVDYELDFKKGKQKLLSDAIWLSNQAEKLKDKFQYKDALSCLNNALLIREKILGKEHIDTAFTYNNIALVYYAMGAYEKALEWYEKARVIVEQALGNEHPFIATTYNGIADVYYAIGEYGVALEWYEKALVIREKALGNEHPDTRATYNRIMAIQKLLK